MFNQDDSVIKTVDDDVLNEVEDFPCLGSHMNSCSKGIIVRIGKARTTLMKLNTIWISILINSIKMNFLQAIVGTVLLYGSNDWTLTQALSKELDGAHTKMLRVVKNITWQQHITNEVLCGGLSNISTAIKDASDPVVTAGGARMKSYTI